MVLMYSFTAQRKAANMIGMVNVQCDSTMDFYASPRRAPNAAGAIGGVEANMVASEVGNEKDRKEKAAVQRKLSYRPLFFRRNIEKIAYAPDGRKMSNGEVLEKHSPNKLWEELIIRTFAKKVEDDVKCPREGMRQLGEGIHTIRSLDRQQSCSMYSLVSDHRLMAEIEEDSKDDDRMVFERNIKMFEKTDIGGEEKGDEEEEGRARASSTVSYQETVFKISTIAARRTQSHKRASDIH